MSNINLTRTLYSGKSFRIKSFLRAPSVYIGGGNLITISAFPILMFSYEPPSSQTSYGERPKDAYFKMNSRNQRRTTRFFKEILTWFESDCYKDLFIVDEHEGKLIVNMDYRNLTAKVNGNKLDAQSMLAVPAVITNDSLQSEGCALAINRTNYTVALTDVDIESIVGILEHFSFQEETQMLINLASHKEFYTTDPPRYGSGVSRKVEW